MSCAAKGALMDLLIDQFANGSVPKDDDEICRIIGASPDEWQSIKNQVLAKFQPDQDGNLFNERMKMERDEREGIRAKRVKASKEGNSKRWPKKDKSVPNGIPNGIANGCVLGVATPASAPAPATG